MKATRSTFAVIVSAVVLVSCTDASRDAVGPRMSESLATMNSAKMNGASPLGSKLVFVSSRDHPTANVYVGLEIYVSNADATNAVRLSNNNFSELFPSWSPNGHEIVFDSNEGFAPANIRSLYIMNDDGTSRRFLSKGTSASWLHNGQKLAFHAAVSSAPGDTDIFVINADGTEKTNLTNYPGSDTDADWSPDGRKILFTSTRNAAHKINIYVMNADGSDVTQLTFNTTGEDAAPDWSPDGKRILFARRGVPAHPRFELYTMNPDGSDLIRLTNNAVLDGTPSWSPDGKQITWHSGNGDSQLWQMNADGSEQHPLTVGPGRNQYVNWGNGHLSK